MLAHNSRLKFRRQHPIFRFVVDFFCNQHKLVVEVDGAHHAEAEQRAYDEARTEWLEQHHYRVIHFSNRDVLSNIEGVLQEFARQCGVETEVR